MEAPRARSDATQTLELSKDPKASESVTQYKMPTVEDYFSDDNEQEIARPYGIESPGSKDVPEPPKPRKPASVGWSYPLTSTNQQHATHRDSGYSEATTMVDEADNIPSLPRTSRMPTPRRYVKLSSRPGSIKPNIVLNSSRRPSIYHQEPRNRDERHSRGGQFNADHYRADDRASGTESSSSWDLVEEISPEDSASRLPTRNLHRKPASRTHAEHQRPSDGSRYRQYPSRHAVPLTNPEHGMWKHQYQSYNDHAYYNPVLPHLSMPFPGEYMVAGSHVHPDDRMSSIHSAYTGTTAVPTPPSSHLHPPASHPYYQSGHTPTQAPFHPSPPHATMPEKSLRASHSDPIKIVEEYLESLRETKEKELLDANRILLWIERRTSKDDSIQVPNVDTYRVRDDDSDVSFDHRSVSTVTTSKRASHPLLLGGLNSAMHRVSFQDQTAGITEQTQDQLLEQMADCSSESSPHPSNCGISSGLTTARDIETIVLPEVEVSHNESHNQTTESVADGAMMLERDALRFEVANLKRQLETNNKRWLDSLIFSTFSQWKKRFRRGPPPGTQRLEWICECGEEMVADLPVKNGTEYREMLEFLTRKPTTQPADGSSATPSEIESGLAQSTFSLPDLSQSAISNGKAPASTFGSSSTYIGSSSSQTLSVQQTDRFARNKYLELCVNVGKYETKLAEIQVASSNATGSTICTDAHLFHQIHDRYFALRKYTWRRFLYRPAGIKFVHFGVQAGYRVGFFTGNPLPSDEVVASKRYEYNLQPPVPPPIDSRTFLHYFWKHSAHAQSTSARYVDRIPKKLGESLIRSLGTDELREGWGIHIIEGPNKAVICWTLFAVLAVSFGVSLGYDIVKNVEDSGFAIGQWMVAALTVGFSALYFSLEDEVNTSFD